MNHAHCKHIYLDEQVYVTRAHVIILVTHGNKHLLYSLPLYALECMLHYMYTTSFVYNLCMHHIFFVLLYTILHAHNKQLKYETR